MMMTRMRSLTRRPRPLTMMAWMRSTPTMLSAAALAARSSTLPPRLRRTPPRATKMRTTTRTLRSRTRRWTTPRWCPPQKLRASRNQSRGYPVKTRDELGFIPSSRRHEWRDGCENPGCSFHLYTDQMS